VGCSVAVGFLDGLNVSTHVSGFLLKPPPPWVASLALVGLGRSWLWCGFAWESLAYVFPSLRMARTFDARPVLRDPPRIVLFVVRVRSRRIFFSARVGALDKPNAKA
jgi:hypothetical protein